ncbi:hypothetical protein STA3757_30520 [Stanieria sp. NIES-3757]|nr:hypothetical protein STA3757_30520 [Stanieria sp. NIES-3757]
MGKRRYSALKRALELTKPMVNGKPTGQSSPPAGSALEQFKKYLGREIDLSYPKAEGSKVKSLAERSILPFAVAANAGTTKAIIKVSQRMIEATPIEAIRTAANYAATNLETDSKLEGFVPAKATVSFISATQTTTDKKDSQLTGIKYDPVNKNVYVVPLGATTGKGYLEVKKDVTTAVKALAGNKSKVKFMNEQI